VKIISLTAENIKRLKAVEIVPDPDGNLVIIAGRNGQGKTSVLDAIWFALGGGAATRETDRVIRDGEDSATVTLDIEDFIITRTWKGDKSTLKVTLPDGSRPASPQKVLDGLLGKLSFDPLGFARLHQREQLDTLLSLTGLDFSMIDRRRAQAFETRTDVNRLVRDLEAQLKDAPVPPKGTPDEELNAATIIESVNRANDWQRYVADKTSTIADAQRRIAELERELDDERRRLEDAAHLLAQAPDPLPDPAVYAAQLEDLEATNRNVRAKKERASLDERLGKQMADATHLTSEIRTLDQQKEDMIKAADMPVKGLGLDEDGVTYLGVPFKQCSSAEQLRVSVAMAMALNPALRVIRITDGSLLDSSSLAVIEDMAQRHDFQVWIEKVDESGEVGVIIEDGEVKA